MLAFTPEAYKSFWEIPLTFRLNGEVQWAHLGGLSAGCRLRATSAPNVR